MHTRAAVEAILFLADKPLRAEVIALLLSVEPDSVRQAIEQLRQQYQAANSALTIRTFNSIDSFEQLVTEEDFAILDDFDPTDSLQDSCPLVTSFLSSPTFDAYSLDTVSYSFPGQVDQAANFKGSGESLELMLEEKYQKLQSQLIQLRQEVAQSIADELTMETKVTRKWQEAADPKEAAQLQFEWEKLRAVNGKLRERLVSLETNVQSAYVQKQNAIAFVKVSDAVSKAKRFLVAPVRKRLLATLCKTFTVIDIKRKIETLLFQSGDEFALEELAELLGESIENTEECLLSLRNDYQQRESAVVINATNFFSMRLADEFLEIPYLAAVPQNVEDTNQLISRLQDCRRRVLQSAETTNVHVERWHCDAKSAVRNKDELDARKSLTYWFFCKEQYESLHQFADGIDLLLARLCDLRERMHERTTTSATGIVLQQPVSVDSNTTLDNAQMAVENARKELRRLDDLINKSKDQAQTWARRATMAAQMHNEELERQALERQRLFEKAAAEIEQRSLQAIFLHEFIKESATCLESSTDLQSQHPEYVMGDTEFDVVERRDFRCYAPKAGQVQISQFIGVQAQHLMSLADACSRRSETYTSAASLQNRAEHLTLQLAQLESMLTETNVDWRSLGPNPFMEMAAQVENELAVLKESEC